MEAYIIELWFSNTHSSYAEYWGFDEKEAIARAEDYANKIGAQVKSITRKSSISEVVR